VRTDTQGFTLRPEVDGDGGIGGVFAARARASGSAASQSGHERNRLFLNDEGQQFVEVSGIGGVDSSADGRSLAIADFDRDGWQDMVLVNANAPLTLLYRNQLGQSDGQPTRNAMIALRFVGANHTAAPSASKSNRGGYGALVTVALGDMTLSREHRCGEGLGAQNSATMLIGIGARRSAPSVTVRWPSGVVLETGDVPAGTLLTVYEEAAQSPTGEHFLAKTYALPAPPRPRIAIPDADTRTLRLPSMESTGGSTSRLTLITTTATWCPSCKTELPELARLREVFTDEQLRMVAVPVDEKEGEDVLLAYAEKYQPAYEMQASMPLDERGLVQRHLEEALIVEALPATIVTDASGKVLLTRLGAPSISQLRGLLAEL
jgi:thiol-disulfide isomerase/thioredoxin